ncbi:MAG: SPOR domain-containing protein [Hahellaceae bacterium]|nr:SPOR domain-containing protein [Hahellaceae bacterium]
MDWLRAHPPSSTVVQLLGSYHEETAAKFLKQYASLGFIYVKSTYKGKEWFVVIDGVYNDKAEARDRITAYPVVIQKQQPWVRSVAGF